jgi:hypothetical protein
LNGWNSRKMTVAAKLASDCCRASPMRAIRMTMTVVKVVPETPRAMRLAATANARMT